MRDGVAGLHEPAGGKRGESETAAPGVALLRAMLHARPDTRLFRALFQYLPLRDSPNENPHVELALHAGDLVLVHGPMDEDRFYWGETLDGRSGLVPSNFVVPDDQLAQLLKASQQSNGADAQHMRPCPAIASTSATVYPPHSLPSSVVSAPSLLRRAQSPSFALQVPAHLAQISHDFTERSQQQQLPDSVCPYPPVDVSRVTVQELRPHDQPAKVPPPRELQVEKRLSRSVLLSWLPPEGGAATQQPAIAQYQVCVDGAVKAVVPGSFKCRALIEDLELEAFVNLSVRAVTAEGQTSADAACTLAVGAEAPVAPQHLRVAQVTPVSTQLSWHPSNSNAEHVVLLNALKVGVCPPAVFQVQLNGLNPSTIYRVSVRTKHPRAVLEKRPVERCVDFKTLPKIGLPDAPADVQVEPGPQPNTLLVSWRPISSQPRPPSRASVHSYLIFADGRNIAQVPNSAADHVLLRLSDFADDPPIFISVRTRTREGAVSADSNVVRVPRAGDLTGKQQQLLSSSLPSHILGNLVSAPSANHCTTALPISAPYTDSIPLAANHLDSGTLPRQQQGGLLLMPASSTPSNPPLAVANGPSTAHQYFTFHPRALYKEFPRVEERPSMLEMEQTYMLRHQQRQRLRSGTPERRSFPQALPQQPQQRAPAAVLPGATTTQAQQQQLQRPVPPHLVRLRGEGMLPGNGTRSEPDLRPARIPGHEDSRWFVAVEDHQSAGPDELPFRRHQLIKVYGDVDRNGFYCGGLRNRFGLVPAGKLIEIARDDLLLAAEQRRPPAEPWVGGRAAPENSSARRMRWGSFKSRSYEQTGDQRSYPPPVFDEEQQPSTSGHRYHTDSWPVDSRNLVARNWPPPSSARNSSYEPSMDRTLRERRLSASEGVAPMAIGAGGHWPRGMNGTKERAKQQWRERAEAEEEDREQRREQTRTRRPPQQQLEAEVEEEEEQFPEEELERAERELAVQQQHQMTRGLASAEKAPLQPLRGMATQLMVAKYDYSRQFSPNVDAEQVELSFRQGDMIVVYGPMDEDGFYLGELNGIRGLVPSNFLQPVGQQPADAAAVRPKGVAFSADLMANHTGPPQPRRVPAAAPQPATSSTAAAAAMSAAARARVTGAAGMTSKAFKVAGTAPSGAGGKTLTKKSSDLSSRKSSQAAAKGAGTAPKKKG